MKMITAEVEVTKDDYHLRIIPVKIRSVCVAEGQRALAIARGLMEKDEMVYQICAPCRNCPLTQPFFDFYNGFKLLEADFWQAHLKNA